MDFLKEPACDVAAGPNARTMFKTERAFYEILRNCATLLFTRVGSM